MARKIVSIRLSEARVEHITWYRKRMKAENTISTITAVLAALEQVVGNKLVRNLTTDDIDRYFAERMPSDVRRPGQLPPLAPSTLNLHITKLNLFFRWCERKAYLDPMVQPMDGREKFDFIPPERIRVVQDDFPRLLDSAPNPRDRMVLALGIYLMARNSEIRTLRIGDVSLAAGTVEVVRWKTKRRDTLPISAELHDELASYFAWYSTFVGAELQKDWHLAPGNKRRVARYSYETRRFEPLPTHEMVLTPEKIMFEAGYGLIVKRALRSIGWDIESDRVGMHTLRRSAARELFDHLRSQTGFDDALLTVMSMLGHARLQTTLIYLGEEREAARRNAVIKDNVMFPRAREIAAPVRRLRMVE